MCQKHLKFYKDLTTSTTNDTADATHCSRCQSTPSFFEISKNTRRSCVHHLKRSVKRVGLVNTMLHKFLLIYLLVFVAFSPLIMCMRHQELPKDSALIQITSSTNSIDTTLLLDAKDDSSEDDESDIVEEEPEELNDEIVKKMYAIQFQTHAKNISLNNVNKDSHLTTVKPSTDFRDTPRRGSCSSTACLARKDMEEEARAAIKQHILTRIGREHEPNGTIKYPEIPKNLEDTIEKLCKENKIRPENCFGTKSSTVEYQSDDPVDSNYDDYDGDRDVVSEEEEVQFLAIENKIYAFPSSKCWH